MARLCGIAVCALLLFAAPASANLRLIADAGTDTGYINLGAVGDAGDTNVLVSELVNGVAQPISPMYLLPVAGAPAIGTAYLKKGVLWQCDRQDRVFQLSWQNTDGSFGSEQLGLRTPPCMNRLRLDAPIKTTVGKLIKMTVRDSWTSGGLFTNLCIRPPVGQVACATLTLLQGEGSADASFRGRQRGRYRIQLTGQGGQQIRAVISVGVKPRKSDLSRLPEVLTTGDSMMQTLNAVLQDRLTDQIQLDSDVRVGSGLSKPELVDWSKLPSTQVSRYAEKATVMFLGTNDASPFGSVNCCDQAWINEYAKRAEAMMRSYTKAGGELFWLNIPMPQEAKRVPSAMAVNAALAIAAQKVSHVHLLDMATLFTPGGAFRATMTYKGASYTVRDSDGIHLTIDGARIASDQVIDAMRKSGVL